MVTASESPTVATVQTAPPAPRDRGDPLEAVLHFGTRAARQGLIAGLVIGLLSHGIFGGRALTSPFEMYKWAVGAREDIHQYLWSTYDVEVVKPPPAPEPEPPKPEEDTKETDVPKPVNNTPTAPAEPPPPAAQAGKVLTAPADPDEPVDLTGNGFVTGEADSYVGGVTAAAGTGKTASYNPAATVGGVAGGTGTGKPPPPPPPKDDGPDRSRAATVTSGSNWSSCPFPPEADADQVDYAVVTLVVTVRPDGSAQSVRVTQDPGHGFGRSARMCALSQRYVTALDRGGNATVGTTAPIRVIFTR